MESCPATRTKPGDYRIRFLFIWFIGTILFVLTPLVIWISFPILFHWAFASLWSGVALMMLIVALFMHTNDSQIRFRIGQSFIRGFLNSDDDSIVATNHTDVYAFCRLQKSLHRQPVVCGFAWSNWISYRIHTCPVIFTHRLYGIHDKVKDQVEWLPGTQISQVQDYYIKDRNKLFPNSPSIGKITIGAWYASKSHGSNGSMITADIPPARLRLFDMQNLSEDVVSSVQYFSTSYDVRRRLCIMGIIFDEKMLVANDVVLRTARVVETFDDVEAFVLKRSLQRFIFIGQRQTVSILWVEYSDVRIPSKFSFKKLQLIALAGLGWGKIDYTEKDDYTDTLYNATYELPDTILPIQSFVGTLISVVNFELFVAYEGATMLWSLIQSMQKLIATNGGRCEIRMINATICLDFAAFLSTVPGVMTGVVESGVRILDVHAGKYDVTEYIPSTATSKKKIVVSY